MKIILIIISIIAISACRKEPPLCGDYFGFEQELFFTFRDESGTNLLSDSSSPYYYEKLNFSYGSNFDYSPEVLFGYPNTDSSVFLLYTGSQHILISSGKLSTDTLSFVYEKEDGESDGCYYEIYHFTVFFNNEMICTDCKERSVYFITIND